MNRIRYYLPAVVAVFVTGCSTLPPPQGRVESTVLTDTAGTRLGRGVAPLAAANPGKSGIHAMPDPRDAFAARILLAEAAEKSIDTQYFIWNGDRVGYALFQALCKAAGRNVRVRLLLDDLGTKGLDPTIAVLDAHPNIEVRLYNPVTIRDHRMPNFVTDFTRVNKRMHNKSFTADNQATVMGGRNIADEYFGAGEGITFADLDVLAVGPAVQEVSKEFDVYWNSASAYPASGFVGAPAPDAAAGLHAKTLAVDNSRIFVGSFNFDQRSARLNTELGLVIGNDVLARRLNRFFDVEVPKIAYEVRLTADGVDLEWVERTASGEIRYDTELETDWNTRMGVELLSILPIEWLL